jgi:hypothetical protein
MSLLATILLNGKRFLGRNLRLEHDDVIYIDGKRINREKTAKIDIVIQGNLESLEVGSASSIEVQGHVGRVQTGSADVSCGDVHGDITTASGSITCGNVGGKIQTVTGDVSTRRT